MRLYYDAAIAFFALPLGVCSTCRQPVKDNPSDAKVLKKGKKGFEHSCIGQYTCKRSMRLYCDAAMAFFAFFSEWIHAFIIAVEDLSFRHKRVKKEKKKDKRSMRLYCDAAMASFALPPGVVPVEDGYLWDNGDAFCS